MVPSRTPRAALLAIALLLCAVLVGLAPGTLVASGPAASSGGSVPASPAASPEQGASPDAVTSPGLGPLPDRTLPNGATAPVDDGTWALADRLTAPTYTADTTAALVDGLARSGIATYADMTSTTPEVALSALPSPMRVLDLEAHALAVGVWAGSTYSGAELDTVVPLPPAAKGMPTTSQLLAGYVATADSPAGALSRALMAGQDLLSPTTAHFPAVVLTLFVSDLATDGGRLAAPTSGAPHAAVAETVGVAGAAAIEGACSGPRNWIDRTISTLFDALKLATPSNVPGRVIVAIWNWLVDKAEAFVREVITAAANLALGTIRSIAMSITVIAKQVAMMLPYAVKVVANGDAGEIPVHARAGSAGGPLHRDGERRRPARLAGPGGRLRRCAWRTSAKLPGRRPSPQVGPPRPCRGRDAWSHRHSRP